MPLIDTAPASRNMDIAIAEKVLGLKVCKCPGKNLAVWGTATQWLHAPDACGLPFPKVYSTDVAVAWEVLKHFEAGRLWSLHYNAGFGYTCYLMSTSTTQVDVKGEGDTAALAICRAALKTIGEAT